MSIGLAIAVGVVTGLALGIVISLTTDLPLAPEVGLVLGALGGCSRVGIARRRVLHPHASSTLVTPRQGGNHGRPPDVHELADERRNAKQGLGPDAIDLQGHLPRAGPRTPGVRTASHD
jgi:hypothetical protein